ncbi:MAG: Lrp/AsnC family transcriptional regulator [Proteobacteria bacterium]|nr:Lrp/AsnC family transcriptional regulator [Pseudomonadota bacterium]
MTTDREFIDVAAKGLEIEKEPLKPLADKLGMTVDEVIERLERLIDEGKVRRFAASVRHQPMGYTYNAMVIVRTDEAHLEAVGTSASGLEAVSHCYQRAHPGGDPYCIYVMMHGRNRETVDKTLAEIMRIKGVKDLEICQSVAELKKTSISGVTTELNNAR